MSSGQIERAPGLQPFKRSAAAALAVCGVDQLSKAFAVSGPVHIDYTENAFLVGGASLARTSALVTAGLVLLTLAGVCVSVATARRHSTTWIALGLIVGGLLSNGVDRARLGAVVDWVPAGPLGRANIADLAALAGAVALATVGYRSAVGPTAATAPAATHRHASGGTAAERSTAAERKQRLARCDRPGSSG